MLGNRTGNDTALSPAAQKLADELYGNYKQTAYDKHQAYVKFLRGVPLDRLGGIAQTTVLSPRRLLEAVELGMLAAEIKATQIESQDSLGGFAVSDVVSDRVLSRAAALAVVRPRAFVESQSAGGITAVPIVTGGDSTFTSALRGQSMSETQSISGLEENFRLGMIRPPIHLVKVRCRVSKSLQEDAGPRLTTIFEQQAAFWKAAKEDKLFLVGTGANEPLGLLAQQAPGTLANGDITVVSSGAAVSITADSVINTFYSVQAQYRAQPGFCSACSTNTLKQIRLLKDGAGRYLFDDRDGTLLGKPLVETPSMPEIAANAFVLLCGDMEGYAIVDRIGLSIVQYDDARTADTDEMYFDVRMRLAGTPAMGVRFSAMKVSAS